MKGEIKTSQKGEILKFLKGAGKQGIRSDWFIANGYPRVAARINELKKDHNIMSNRDGAYVRYQYWGEK